MKRITYFYWATVLTLTGLGFWQPTIFLPILFLFLVLRIEMLKMNLDVIQKDNNKRFDELVSSVNVISQNIRTTSKDNFKLRTEFNKKLDVVIKRLTYIEKHGGIKNQQNRHEKNNSNQTQKNQG
jgi:hypothetical protein